MYSPILLIHKASLIWKDLLNWFDSKSVTQVLMQSCFSLDISTLGKKIKKKIGFAVPYLMLFISAIWLYAILCQLRFTLY